MQFVVANGGERRRPKRAAASAYATRSADVSSPSEDDKERRFEEMVALTRQNSEWGSSEHLQAFCQVFKVDINVYTMDGVQAFRDVNAKREEHRDVIHVAFHDFKHYSSVRTQDGCHKGLLARSFCLNEQSTDSKEANCDLKEHISADARAVQTVALETNIIKDHKTEVESTIPATKNLHITDTPPSSVTSHLVDTNPVSNDSAPKNDAGLAVDVFPPWDIQSIQDGLGGRYDRDTIVDMLQKCRGDIDRAFAALLGDKNDEEKKVIPGPSFKSSLQVSRSSSPFSTGSKRSADDSDDSEDPRPAIRRGRPKKRLVSNLTLGVGISFRDEQNEVVSLNLRMPSAAEKAERVETGQSETVPEDPVSVVPETLPTKGPRRSGRLSRPRPVSP